MRHGYRSQMSSNTKRFSCRLCDLTIRDNDAIVVIADDEPLHAPCAEAAFSASTEWKHTSVTTLSQWARGVGWGSASN